MRRERRKQQRDLGNSCSCRMRKLKKRTRVQEAEYEDFNLFPWRLDLLRWRIDSKINAFNF